MATKNRSGRLKIPVRSPSRATDSPRKFSVNIGISAHCTGISVYRYTDFRFDFSPLKHGGALEKLVFSSVLFFRAIYIGYRQSHVAIHIRSIQTPEKETDSGGNTCLLPGI